MENVLSMEPELECFGLWLWKGKREDDEMSGSYRMIGTYSTT